MEWMQSNFSICFYSMHKQRSRNKISISTATNLHREKWFDSKKSTTTLELKEIFIQNLTLALFYLNIL